MNRYYVTAVAVLAGSVAAAQSPIIAQIVDGGGWQTTIVLTNSTTVATSANLSFFSEVGSGATQPWNLQFQEGSGGKTFTVPPAGTLLLHTAGTAASTTVGWGQVQSGSGITAYAVLTERVPGGSNQIAMTPGASSTQGILVPFDNTNGNVTSVALVNPTGINESIAVGIQLNSGTSSQPSAIALPAQGHIGFSVTQQFPSTNGQSGQLEFFSSGGSVGALCLLFDPTGAFTAMPVLSETGSPIIVAGQTQGAGAFSQYNVINLNNLTFTVGSDASLPWSDTITSDGNGGFLPAGAGPDFILAFEDPSQSVAIVEIQFLGVVASGTTFKFQGLSVGPDSFMSDRSEIAYAMTSASVTVTLSTPNGVPAGGTVKGTFTFSSGLATLTGTISGTYFAY